MSEIPILCPCSAIPCGLLGRCLPQLNMLWTIDPPVNDLEAFPSSHCHEGLATLLFLAFIPGVVTAPGTFHRDTG